MDQVIITAALTGAVTPQAKNEHIPITPEEIAADAYACWKAGAAMVHLHMRDENSKGTMDVERFRRTIELIRAHKDCDVIINCTSSGEDDAADDRRMEHMRTLDGIEVGTYDAGTFNWMPAGVFMNTPAFLEKLGKTYLERGIKPEVEIFDAGMLSVANYFREQGSLKAPVHYQLCMGVLGGMPATVENLVYLVNHLPEGSTWSAFGVGKGHLPILYATLALGGHIRVGLEDNVYFSKGVKATNVQLVERAAQAVRTFGKQPATPAQAREILGLKPL